MAGTGTGGQCCGMPRGEGSSGWWFASQSSSGRRRTGAGAGTSVRRRTGAGAGTSRWCSGWPAKAGRSPSRMTTGVPRSGPRYTPAISRGAVTGQQRRVGHPAGHRSGLPALRRGRRRPSRGGAVAGRQRWVGRPAGQRRGHPALDRGAEGSSRCGAVAGRQRRVAHPAG